MRHAIDDMGSGSARRLPDYVGLEVIILFFVLLFLLAAVLFILWIVFYRG